MKTTYLFLAAVTILVVHAKRPSPMSRSGSCRTPKRCSEKNGTCQKKGTCSGEESRGCRGKLGCRCCNADTTATQCASLGGSCVVTGSRCNGTLTDLFNSCGDYCTCCHTPDPEDESDSESESGEESCSSKECQEGFFKAEGSCQCYKFYVDFKGSYTDAKEKCIADGLVLAAPANPINVRKYIVETYAGAGYPYTWLSARGDGNSWVWENSGDLLSDTDPLWLGGYPQTGALTGGVGNKRCLLLVNDKGNMDSVPDKVYLPYVCTYDYYALCE